MWRWIKWFLIIWGILILVSVYTVKGAISMSQRLGATALVAVVARFTIIGDRKPERKKQPWKPRCELLLHPPMDPTIVYRIEDGKIFAGVDQVPIYEIKGNKIYPRMVRGPIFRIEKNKVYREKEKEPVFTIEGNKVYYVPSGKVAYEIEALW